MNRKTLSQVRVTKTVMILFGISIFFFVLSFFAEHIKLFISNTSMSHYASRTYDTIQIIAGTLAWITGTIIVLRFIYFVYWNGIFLRHMGVDKPPTVFVALTAIIFWTICFMGISHTVYEIHVSYFIAPGTGLLAGIGLGLKDYISAIFSSVFVILERPFQIGDWIHVKNTDPGKVISVDWRTTTIVTVENSTIVIPNHLITTTSLVNFSKPHKRYMKTVQVKINSYYNPDFISKILINAAQSSEGVLLFDEDGISINPDIDILECENDLLTYRVKFFVKDYGDFDTDDHVYAKIVQALAVHGIPLGIEKKYTLETVVKGKRMELSDIIHTIPIFKMLKKEEIKVLINSAKQHVFYQDDVIFNQGDQHASLYIISEGCVSISIKKNKKETEVSRLSAGDFLGEMAFLLGNKRSATVTALTYTKIYEIDSSHMKQIIEKRPEITNFLSEVVTERSAFVDEKLQKGTKADKREETSAQHVKSQIASFFGLKK